MDIKDKITLIVLVILFIFVLIFAVNLLEFVSSDKALEARVGYDQKYFNAEIMTTLQIQDNMTTPDKMKIIEFNCKSYVGISDNWIYTCMEQLSEKTFNTLPMQMTKEPYGT